MQRTERKNFSRQGLMELEKLGLCQQLSCSGLGTCSPGPPWPASPPQHPGSQRLPFLSRLCRRRSVARPPAQTPPGQADSAGMWVPWG